ncbi:MAG: glucosidase [Gammaproteobacteria bacterium]
MNDETEYTPADDAERRRLEDDHDWLAWGPYLAERAWGTVREDYSARGTAWEYFPHDHARSRAYRWNEDGLGGICDREQRLCLALALWNGEDPILKERAFGLTGNEGNHSEDVKEVYFYADATPTHSYLEYQYCYPQSAYPYERLVRENRRRSRSEPSYNLIDSGAFEHNRFWDVRVEYARQSPGRTLVRITATNRGDRHASLWLLPQLWFRNDWSWGDGHVRPEIAPIPDMPANRWGVITSHRSLETMHLYGQGDAELLFTENETNHKRLWGADNSSPWVKDAFHRHLVDAEPSAVNPQQHGSKFAAVYHRPAEPGAAISIELVLSDMALDDPFVNSAALFTQRREEAGRFYSGILPGATPEDHAIMRQAFAGMVWSKQFFHYDVERWLQGDQLPSPPARQHGRNANWRNMKAADIISMPDCWEYPWFAAWDLAFHTATLAHIDIDFAKQQIELMVNERYLHPNGQMPAYEWAFGDTNPPVHAWGALKVFRAEQQQRGEGDTGYLQRVFHKLLLNYSWWINRKDGHGHNLFEGGFLGLDNISVYDRSRDLPTGYTLKQADATGWMAMFSVNMVVMALEINRKNPAYEDIAIQCYLQFLAIAETIAGGDDGGVSLWDFDAGFFKDLLITPQNEAHYIDVYSWVGLIPLFACEVIDQRLLQAAPRFRELLREHKRGLFRGNYICACPESENDRGEHLLALVDHSQLPRILKRLLNKDEFFSPHGIRSLSKLHQQHHNLGHIPGLGDTHIEYVPGESSSPLFGGNSNWRGPIWIPTNYALIQALEKYHRFLGDGFTAPVPHLDNRKLNMREIAAEIAARLVGLYRRDENGNIPAMRSAAPFTGVDRPLYNFYEYFHAETGQGLGAAHQTGWTGLLANLVMRQYQRDIPVRGTEPTV